MDSVSRYLVREGLRAVRAQELPAPARREIERRIESHGYDAAAHNVGGIECCCPHVHGTGDSCIQVSGRWLRRFADVRVGAAALASIALRASATPAEPAPDLAGFRSTHPDELGADALQYVSPDMALLSWFLTRPSEDAERRFRELSADWEAFERAGITTAELGRELAHLEPDVKAWQAFRDAWRDGKADLTNLQAREADANRIRRELYERSKDPRFARNKDLRGGDIENANALLQASANVDQAARQSARTVRSFWADIPWQLKAGGVAAIGLFALTQIATLAGALGRPLAELSRAFGRKERRS